jgi:predicted DCC family thiol-disulfide oxidoreductase YuxK
LCRLSGSVIAARGPAIVAVFFSTAPSDSGHARGSALQARTASALHRTAASTASALEVLYDGSCPLCAAEIGLLRRTRVGSDASRTVFVDISARGFDEEARGVPLDRLMDEMHVWEPASGVMHTRVPAFVRLYEHLGAPRWAVAWTSFYPFSSLLDAAYTRFARNRHRIAAWLPAPKKAGRVTE